MKLKYPLHVMKMADTWAAVPVGSGERRFNGYVKTQGRFFVLLDSFSVLDPTKPKTRLNHFYR